MELSNTLICNINEIDRLFKSNNFADFKAFLDQTTDRIVLPYADSVTEITRRTVFIGSTNQAAFLRDVTGNRRVEIIHTSKLDYRHSVNIDMLWGQVYNIYKEGEKWWLDERDPVESRIIEMRDRINAGSMYIGNDSLLETLEEVFDTARTGEDDIQWLTFKQIRQICGLNNMTTNSQQFNHAKRACHLWSAQVSGLDARTGSGVRPRMYYPMPPVRDTAMPDLTDDTPIKIKSQKEMDILKEMNDLQKKLDDLKQARASLANDSDEVA
jgi:predicted P-loop ATPase